MTSALLSRLQPMVLQAWQRRSALAHFLYPLGLMHRQWRRFKLRQGRRPHSRPAVLPVPVVVIGNLFVGGTGKTPLTIALIRMLQARGWTPGVVSRGYGSTVSVARAVLPSGGADDYGDEPLLIAQTTDVPVVVGAQRLKAAQLLLNLNPRVDIVLSDDGLQHLALPRDVEIAVIDHRGLGNGLLIPAGPLRDPPERLAQVDAVVFNDLPGRPRPTVRLYSPFFSLNTGAGSIYALKDPDRVASLAELVEEQRQSSLRIVAACGIGSPERFFDMLASAGLAFQRMALADHYDFKVNPLAGCAFDVALITEKDAVKCRANPVLASDGRLCVVRLSATVDDALVDLIEARVGLCPSVAAAQPTPP